MKILHLLASPTFSGPAENVLGLALAQRELGHEVSVAVDRKRTVVTSEELFVPKLESAGLLDRGGFELSVKSLPLHVLRDLRLLRKSSANVVHAHFSHDHWIARLGRPRGAKLVRSLHAPRSLRSTLPAADAFTVPSSDLLPRLSGKRVQVLPPLLAPGFRPGARQRALLGLPEQRLVGMVSTFQTSRRHLLALEALTELRDELHLVLLGDGELEPALRSKVRELGLERSVTFAGYQSGDRYIQYLQAFDDVWILGLGNDWSARAAAQARVCGARVTGVREGAVPDFADVLLAEPTARALVEAARGSTRRQVTVESPRDIAERILALYVDCG